MNDPSEHVTARPVRRVHVLQEAPAGRPIRRFLWEATTGALSVVVGLAVFAMIVAALQILFRFPG